MDRVQLDRRPAEPIGDGAEGRGQWNRQVADPDTDPDDERDRRQRHLRQAPRQGEQLRQRGRDASDGDSDIVDLGPSTAVQDKPQSFIEKHKPKLVIVAVVLLRPAGLAGGGQGKER